MKTLSVRSIFLFLISLCLITVGGLTLSMSTYEKARAETVAVETIENSVPSYFSAVEYTNSGVKAESSLIDEGIFLYNSTATGQNYLTLSFSFNGDSLISNASSDVYKYVVYPNEEDLTTFYFFTFESLTLTINGENYSLSDSSYKFSQAANASFENFTYTPEEFQMVFNTTGENSNFVSGYNNAISLLDSQNNVVEGLYEVSLQYTIYICDQSGETDITYAGAEAADTFSSTTSSLTYQFLVLDETEYLSNSRPVVTDNNFSSSIAIAESVSATYGYYFYYNYSSADNSIASITYDATRYDVSIAKTLGTTTDSATIVYNYENNSYTYSGEEIVTYISSDPDSDGKSNTCTIYFYDLGNYSLVFNAVYTTSIDSDYINYKLSSITDNTRQVMVYVFGYQLSYLDKDEAGTTYTEFKVNNISSESAYYSDSADITSGFNKEVGKNDSSNFIITNVDTYITENNISPVETNQTPLRFTSNATLSSNATIFCTKANYSQSINVNNTTYYYSTYSGGTINATGTYIILMSYTFGSYYSSSTQPASSTVFYQVFYFTISDTTPSLTLVTESGSTVPKYTNEDVTITDENILKIHNKSLTIRVYAQDFSGNYLSAFGGTYGVNFESISGYVLDSTTGASVTLSDNAHYTIRIFYTYATSDISFNINSTLSSDLIKREITFTIDKEELDGVTARAVTASSTTSNYLINYEISPIASGSAITTNQSIVISWNEKASGSATYATYRYFAITSASLNNTSSDTLYSFLKNNTTSYLPVSYELDLTENSVIWNNYAGNTIDISSTISSNYVLSSSSPGLYLFDFYDSAGNHSYQIFIIDTTTPIFVVSSDNTNYSVASSYLYIENDTTLYWADYKLISIDISIGDIDFNNSQVYQNGEFGESYINDNIGSYNLFQDQYGYGNIDIYKAFYNQLIDGTNNDTPLFQYVSANNTTSLYLTISNGSDYCYYNNSGSSTSYEIYSNAYASGCNNAITFTTDSEYTARVLIRDASNTKIDQSNSNTVYQYTSYYSAMQVIIVSHDSSALRLYYTSDSSGDISLTSSSSIDPITDDEGNVSLISYYAPISVNQTINISYIATPEASSSYAIQLDSITMTYYSFATQSTTDTISYYYMSFSSQGTTTTLYDYSNDGQNSETSTATLNVSSGTTLAGLYVITRTYYIDDTGTTEYSFNSDDYLTRVFVFIIDRNDVISGATTITGEDNERHAESLVGGEIFVAMYDTNESSSLVVTFPDAANGNTTNTSLVTGSLTTNKLPVSVYVPAYKYTKYTKLVNGTNSYSYNVELDDYTYYSTVTYTAEGQTDKTITYTQTDIEEYVIFAEIYKDGSTTPLYRTSVVFNNPTKNNILAAVNSTTNYLNFYDSSNNLVSHITEEGEYTLYVYQAYNAVAEIDGSTFKKSSTFTFTVQKTDPDFDVSETGGTALSYETVNGVTVYHTNKSELRVTWDMATDDYTAEIDQTKITIKINGGSETVTTFAKVFSNITKNTTANLYTATLNLYDVNGTNIYSNGSYIDITMQYENHNSSYYNTVHKRIYIDTEAPYTNISNLVNEVISSSNGYITESDLRVYTDDNSTTYSTLTGNEKYICYNTSNVSGTYRYYSYAVTSSYISDLLSSDESDFVYYKALSSSYKYGSSGYEADPYGFTASNGYSVLSSSSTLEVGTYYEIVEMDIAGNKTIYTIYLIDELTETLDDYTIIDYTVNNEDENSESGREYDFTREDYILAVNNSMNVTIYTPTGFSLTAIDYLKNTWLIFSATTTSSSGIAGVTTYYLISPWIAEGSAYRLSDGTTVSLSEILNGNTDSAKKDVLTFYNTYKGASTSTTSFYFNTRNYTISSTTSNSSTENIMFSQPSTSELNSTTTAYGYLAGLKIYLAEAEAGTTGSEDNPFYDVENALGLTSIWSNSNYAYVTASYANGYMTFVLTASLADDTKIIYEYVDNYGNYYREIHLYNETYIQTPISSENQLYSFNYNDGYGSKLYYVTEDGFRYTYNKNKYYMIAYIKQNSNWDYMITNTNDVTITSDDTTSSVRVNTFNVVDTSSSYAYFICLNIYDYDDVDITTNMTSADPITQIYFILVDNVPNIETSNSATLSNSFKLTSSGLNVTSSVLGLDESGNQDSSLKVDYYSSVYLNYNVSTSNLLPVAFYLSTNGVDYEEIENGQEITCLDGEDSTTYYLKVWYDIDDIATLGYINQYSSDYTYIFEYVPSYQIYTFVLSSALSTAYYVMFEEDGTSSIIQRSGQTYIASVSSTTTKQYANHYIINTSYENRSNVTIVTNTEQYITAVENDGYYDDGNGVRTYTYTISNVDSVANLTNVSKFSTTIAITFVPPTSQIVSEFYTTSLSTGTVNTNYNLINYTTHSIIVTSGSTRDSIELRWTKYYAITQNAISIHISKNGVELEPTVYSDGNYYYTYITRSGFYTISFEDVSGNREVFCYGTSSQTETFTLVFIKDVSFYLTYTNPLTEEEITTEPIKQATYNGTVTLTIDTTLLGYYHNRAVAIEVYKDGSLYTDYVYDTTTRSYTFTETGYYSVTFSAASYEDEDTQIRTETYTFTILEANEYRSSYIINKYSNYYIESIYKNNVDVTSLYTSSLALDTIVVNSTIYLSELTLSYLDEKTGAGTYYITVNSNEKMYSSDSLMSSWTFKVIIQVGSLDLITSSIDAGSSTTGTITISFNAENVYNEFGQSVVQVIYYDSSDNAHTYYSFDVDGTTSDVQTASLRDTHVYFVQIVSPSGNLLYSFKVTRNEPFNTATILVIIAAVALVIAIIIIVVVLRKRISVR